MCARFIVRTPSCFFGPEMVFGMVSIIKEKPVVDFSIAADAPRNRLVRVRAVMTVIAVQVAEAMAEIPERQEIENHVTPVEHKHGEQRDRERRQLKISPKHVIIAAFAQFLTNRADIVAEKTEENISPWTLRFAVVPMAVDGQPIDCITGFILSIRISFVVLHMDAVVHRLRKTVRDRLRDSKEPIQQF
jgi:hypothetical protein